MMSGKKDLNSFTDMDLRRSRQTMYAALFALAAFLAFWLKQEYERGKETMMVVMHLEIATEMISDQHDDLEGLLAEVERLGGGLKGLEGSDVRIATRMRTAEELSEDILVRVVEGDSVDTRTVVIMKQFNTDHADSVHVRIPAMSDGNLKVREPSIQAALLNIWPQSAFALLLFGFMLLGVRLMQRNLQREQALIKEKSSLISNMTHELKTPVATIAVALEAIQDFNVRSDREKTNKYLSAARKELSRLSDSVDMVMDLSRIEQGAAIYEKERIVLRKLVDEVVELMHPQLELNGMSIRIVGESSLTVQADPRHLRNVFINLIDNAVKYGRPNGNISVELSSEAEQVMITVEDDGIGIPSEYHEAVFDRFFRVKDQDLHNVKGDGLGLSYVKEIIEAHGGRVTLVSEKGRGSRFEIKLPVNNE